MIERVAVGDGTPEGTNSAYVLPERGVVIDPGPPTDGAWADLRDGLERAGLALVDLEYVLVTHWHADHVGLAPRLAEAANATVAMGAEDAPLLADYATERERRLERDAATMRSWGVPDDVVDAVIAGDEPSPVPDSYPVETLSDGDRIAGLEVVATPGHTLGHTAFGTGEATVVGDAVLPTYTPNVGGSDTRTTDPLATYRDSLERLAARPGRLLPGHGTTVDRDRIETIRAHHRERTARVLEALAELGRATPWELARELFGDLAGIHVKFGAGEVTAHLERLEREREREVDRIDAEPVSYRLLETVE